MRTYILLKDLPDVKAGAEFKLGEATDAYYLTSDKTGTKYNCYCYPVDFVKNNSEWFAVPYPTNPHDIKAQEDFKKHCMSHKKQTKVAKTYILQKDLPNVKAGANFSFVSETGLYHQNGDKYLVSYSVSNIENNPEWFKEKEEPKHTIIAMQHGGNGIHYTLNDGEAITISKERLAELLIAENKGELFISTEKDIIKRIKAVNFILSIAYLSEEDRNTLLNMVDELSGTTLSRE